VPGADDVAIPVRKVTHHHDERVGAEDGGLGDGGLVVGQRLSLLGRVHGGEKAAAAEA